MSNQPPPAPTASTIGPCPTFIRRTPRYLKFTQHHRTILISDHVSASISPCYLEVGLLYSYHVCCVAKRAVSAELTSFRRRTDVYITSFWHLAPAVTLSRNIVSLLQPIRYARCQFSIRYLALKIRSLLLSAVQRRKFVYISVCFHSGVHCTEVKVHTCDLTWFNAGSFRKSR